MSSLHDSIRSDRELLPTNTKGKAFVTHIRQLDLNEENHWRTINGWINSNCETVETALLASFVYIAGGWTKEVPELIVKEMGCESLKEALTAIDNGKLTKADFEARGQWHQHRKSHYKYVHEIVEEFADITVDSHSIESFTDAISHLSTLDQQTLTETSDEASARSKTFGTALSSFSVHRFRSLAAFDWLELLIRVHGFRWLAPPKLKPDYLNTGSQPSRGFVRLFGEDNKKLIDSDGKVRDTPQSRECLAKLERFGREELGYDDISVVFDIESALCLFAKMDQHEIELLAANQGTPITQDHIC